MRGDEEKVGKLLKSFSRIAVREKEAVQWVWPDDSHTLWSAALYPEADTIEEAVSAALNLYAIVHG